MAVPEPDTRYDKTEAERVAPERLVTVGTRQWWVRMDRETLYRTRRDAQHARRGVPLFRILNSPTPDKP